MMEIDPRLRDSSQKGPDPYPAAPPPAYNLNPIRLPPPTHYAPGLPPLAQDTGHPYYAANRGPHPLHPPLADAQLHNDPAVLPLQQADDANADPKRPRACEACRGLKVRCEPDPVKQTCRRCAKAGRHCVVTVPSRKRQKKTDSRVAELEKKIDALTASLQATKKESMDGSDGDSFVEEGVQRAPEPSGNSWIPPPEQMVESPSGSSRRPSTYSKSPSVSRKRKPSDYIDVEDHAESSNANSLAVPTGHSSGNGPRKAQKLPSPNASANPSVRRPSIDPSLPSHEYADVVDRKILDAAKAAEIFNHYTQNMAKHLPAVVFPPNVTAGDIRGTKPTLFLAILSAASGQDHPDLQRVLQREIKRVFADRIICQGEKSLELIQALQISTIWFDDYRGVKAYQLIHMAVIMAMSMGLGRGSTRPAKGRFLGLWRDMDNYQISGPSTRSVEDRRAWLACYFISSQHAMGLKLPNLIPWSQYLEECLEVLESSQDAMPSDKELCLWVRLQRIADETNEQFQVEDVNISDPKIQFTLKGFSRQLEDWEKRKAKNLFSKALDLGYHASILCVHQNALGMEDPKSLKDNEDPQEISERQPSHLSPAYISALTTSLKSVHKALDTFLSFTADDVRSIPTIFFLRVAYVIVSLLSLFFTTTSPNSELGRVMSVADIKVEFYMQGVIDVSRSAAAEGKSRPVQNFLMTLLMLKNAVERQKSGRTNRPEDIAKSVKTDAQPVDTEVSTPRQGYRKISLSEDIQNGLNGNTSNPLPQEDRSQIAQEAPQHQPVQPPHHSDSIGSTPLDMLSTVATRQPAGSNRQTVDGGNVWYDYHNGMGTNATGPYSQAYYPHAPDVGYYAGDQGAVLDPNLQQPAFGMVPPEEDMFSMFMNGGLVAILQHNPDLLAHTHYENMPWEGHP